MLLGDLWSAYVPTNHSRLDRAMVSSQSRSNATQMLYGSTSAFSNSYLHLSDPTSSSFFTAQSKLNNLWTPPVICHSAADLLHPSKRRTTPLIECAVACVTGCRSSPFPHHHALCSSTCTLACKQPRSSPPDLPPNPLALPEVAHPCMLPLIWKVFPCLRPAKHLYSPLPSMTGNLADHLEPIKLVAGLLPPNISVLFISTPLCGFQTISTHQKGKGKGNHPAFTRH